MKINIQYINDSQGNIKAVQLPFPEWEKILLKLRKQQQMLKLRADLTEAFEQLQVLKNRKKKNKLKEFLNEL